MLESAEALSTLRGNAPTKEEKPSPGKVMKADAERKSEEDIKSDKGAVCPSEDMKTLLEEASRMLKTMTSGSTSSEAAGAEHMEDLRIKQLQKQLDDPPNWWWKQDEGPAIGQGTSNGDSDGSN